MKESKVKPSSSPLVKKEQPETLAKMSFWQAMTEVLNGKKVARDEWTDVESYGFLQNEVLCIHRADGDHSWLLSRGDLVAVDWIVIS